MSPTFIASKSYGIAVYLKAHLSTSSLCSLYRPSKHHVIAGVAVYSYDRVHVAVCVDYSPPQGIKKRTKAVCIKFRLGEEIS